MPTGRHARSPGGTRNTFAPQSTALRADAAEFARKALGEWGFDGLKIDGQHLNAAPECFNPAHEHASPADAPEGVPGFFKAIWDSAQAVKPGAVIESAPAAPATPTSRCPTST